MLAYIYIKTFLTTRIFGLGPARTTYVVRMMQVIKRQNVLKVMLQALILYSAPVLSDEMIFSISVTQASCSISAPSSIEVGYIVRGENAQKKTTGFEVSANCPEPLNTDKPVIRLALDSLYENINSPAGVIIRKIGSKDADGYGIGIYNKDGTLVSENQSVAISTTGKNSYSAGIACPNGCKNLTSFGQIEAKIIITAEYN